MSNFASVSRSGASVSPSAGGARGLLKRNAALAARLRELGARGTAAAAALTRPGAPPPHDLTMALGEATREFNALRDEAFAAAAELYQDRAQFRSSLVESLLSPLFLILFLIFAGTWILGMFMPLICLITSLSGGGHS